MNVTLTLLDTGFCRQLEAISLGGGRFQSIRFHAVAGCMHHPDHGLLLFDTGYAPHFFTAAARFPYSLYAKATPVFTERSQCVKEQLASKGIGPEQVTGIFISHFHADHIAGLHDFPGARLYCFRSAYEEVKGLKGIAAVRRGFLPELMPEDFEERAIFIDDGPKIRLSGEYHPFEEAYDPFADKSLLAVDLSGHAKGLFGLFLRDTQDRDIFLCADAAWSSEAYRKHRPPHPVAHLIKADAASYLRNLRRLHELHRSWPELYILPTHCPEVHELSKGEFAWS
ncbi:MBL fold metallo-hydrolase [Brevibacillus borstelensis]|uniref:MBL fold metallo-hydrolase n=1 Tax=Brevibacillus borstelensis TaxID=45462 RepID=UPI0004F301A8|nr:MBL fold metallo-hydrolase [Brevibacillus borstelensis]KKX55255.1 hydrolase glyoxylase [Brevibacillus borstelensis cifa_chp40]MCC0563122.1 MBL fold metallo-hydrolase [Brevibacillus borstelensis]MCM3469065.1 MBL fold metallo-hydrolase [Brevibacillus borstelensis]MCM3558451.1 MBL fold metallo-hydrolase [Brevibacillus borstelensis]MCM3590415.1 MBL fold metallo-hydrolase [Brevibacillus borstelensis]